MTNRLLILVTACGFLLAAWLDNPTHYEPTEQYQKDRQAVVWVGGEIVSQYPRP